MTLRIPGRVAWPLWGLAMLLAATATALQAANHGVHSELVPGVFFVFGFGTVGAVVAARRPSHPVGWLFVAVGLVSAVTVLSVEYAVRAIVTRPRVAAGRRVGRLGGALDLASELRSLELPGTAVPHRAAAVATLAPDRLAAGRVLGRADPLHHAPDEAT